MMNDMISPELETLLGRELFEHVPFNVAIIDRDFNVVAANENFKEYFGDWRRKKCHEVYKGSLQRCASCQAQATFEDGRVRVSDETGVDRQGRTSHYVVHLAPVKDDRQKVQYIIEMTTDLTETRRWQREYDLFLERVPCCVLVVDRQFRIIRDNEKFRQTFGDGRGKLCYEVCKRRKTICTNCPAALTFDDGAEHTSNEVGVHPDGTPAYYVVSSSPLSRGASGVAHVIEIATDVTEVHQLQGELIKARDYYGSLIRNSGTGILAVDMMNRAKVMNHAARELLGLNAGGLPGQRRLRQMLPAEFFGRDFEKVRTLDLPEALIHPRQGPEVPVRFFAVKLQSRGKQLGRAAFLQDLREVKRLEQDKLEAERLAAVGQTVAGLAHSIKNLLMGLEGGMYMVDSGLRRGNAGRIANGWEILQRNFKKTTALVKDFLSFAKGRVPELHLTDPVVLGRSVVELYRDAARAQGVELVLESGEVVAETLLDPEGVETALTNLLSNAIDAATLREKPGGRVVLCIRDDADDLLFEVSDNGRGMDWAVKGRVFTTFFTTKGNKGTGLGLLTTRKIVQEHGGRVEVESTVGAGSLFRMRFPRGRLQALAAAAAKAAKEKSTGARPSQEKP